MIQRQLKLKLTKRQERQLDEWLWVLSGVYNWTIRKLEQDRRDGIYWSYFSLRNLLLGHGQKIGVPAHAIYGTVKTAYDARTRYLKRISGRPKLKGMRNKLTGIPIYRRVNLRPQNKVALTGLGRVRYFKQQIPDGQIKMGRIVKRASGWHLCLFIDVEPNPITVTASNAVGIDAGFLNLLTFSNGLKVSHPRELELSALRLAQSQRGNNRRLSARIHEHIGNQRKDRNHKLSREIVSENSFVAFSKDSHSGIARKFGKSVASSGHYQLRSMLDYKSKCRTDGLGTYIEVPSRNSTRTCSICGALTGPQGWTGLKVRQWDCGACGAHHDRDINAAVNTLIVGAGIAHEILATVARNPTMTGCSS